MLVPCVQAQRIFAFGLSLHQTNIGLIRVRGSSVHAVELVRTESLVSLFAGSYGLSHMQLQQQQLERFGDLVAVRDLPNLATLQWAAGRSYSVVQ